MTTTTTPPAPEHLGALAVLLVNPNIAPDTLRTVATAAMRAYVNGLGIGVPGERHAAVIAGFMDALTDEAPGA